MTLNVTIQLSLGRFAVSVDPNDTVRAAKKKIRFTCPQVAQVNFNLFHINYNGSYITDESKTVASYFVEEGSVLHFVKKTTCPAAALDTEKKAEE